MQMQNTFYSSNSNNVNNGVNSVMISKKVYSRKQLTEWVENQNVNLQKIINPSSFTRLTTDTLKNGIFFSSILCRIFPQDSSTIKSKLNIKPVTEYDFEKNLQLVKKILTKNNINMNINVNQVLKSKNCFDLLNGFRNLYDLKGNSNGEGNDGEMTNTYSNNNSQVKVKQVTQNNHNNNNNNNNLANSISPTKTISSLCQIPHSGFKTNRESSSSKHLQTLSQQKSRPYSTTKSQHPFNKPNKSPKDMLFITENQLNDNNNKSQYNSMMIMMSHDKNSINNKNNDNNNENTHTIKMISKKNRSSELRVTQNNLSEYDSIDDYNNEVFYEMALEESVQSFKNILLRFKSKIQEGCQKHITYQEYLSEVNNVISVTK